MPFLVAQFVCSCHVLIPLPVLTPVSVNLPTIKDSFAALMMDRTALRLNLTKDGSRLCFQVLCLCVCVVLVHEHFALVVWG